MPPNGPDAQLRGTVPPTVAARRYHGSNCGAVWLGAVLQRPVGRRAGLAGCRSLRLAAKGTRDTEPLLVPVLDHVGAPQIGASSWPALVRAPRPVSRLRQTPTSAPSIDRLSTSSIRTLARRRARVCGPLRRLSITADFTRLRVAAVRSAWERRARLGAGMRTPWLTGGSRLRRRRVAPLAARRASPWEATHRRFAPAGAPRRGPSRRCACGSA